MNGGMKLRLNASPWCPACVTPVAVHPRAGVTPQPWRLGAGAAVCIMLLILAITAGRGTASAPLGAALGMGAAARTPGLAPAAGRAAAATALTARLASFLGCIALPTAPCVPGRKVATDAGLKGEPGGSTGERSDRMSGHGGAGLGRGWVSVLGPRGATIGEKWLGESCS